MLLMLVTCVACVLQLDGDMHGTVGAGYVYPCNLGGGGGCHLGSASPGGRGEPMGGDFKGPVGQKDIHRGAWIFV